MENRWIEGIKQERTVSSLLPSARRARSSSAFVPQGRNCFAARQHADVKTNKQETKGIANEKRCSARNKDMKTTEKDF